MSIMFNNGVLLFRGSSLAMSSECCCEEAPPVCDTLPDELELEISYCGHTWVYPMVRGANGKWTTECPSWSECRGGPCAPGGQGNYFDCFTFSCSADQYYLEAAGPCGPGASAGQPCTGTPTDWGRAQITSLDPFECIWFDTPLPLLSGVCCDTYPEDVTCSEIPVFTVRLPSTP